VYSEGDAAVPPALSRGDVLRSTISSAGKQDAEEEFFFHTFNELHDHQKQIVIFERRPRRKRSGLLERYVPGLSGLLADIQPPDLETKMAILDKKAEAEGVKLPMMCAPSWRKDKLMCAIEGSSSSYCVSSVDRNTVHFADRHSKVLKHLVMCRPEIDHHSIQKAVAERFFKSSNALKERATPRGGLPAPVPCPVNGIDRASLPRSAGRSEESTTHCDSFREQIEQARHIDPELNRPPQSKDYSMNFVVFPQPRLNRL